MKHLPREVVDPVASGAFAAALAVAAVGVARAVLRPGTAAIQLGAGLGLALDFFLATGLLRLAAGPNLRSLGLVAVVIVVRKVASSGVKAAQRALHGAAGLRLRA